MSSANLSGSRWAPASQRNHSHVQQSVSMSAPISGTTTTAAVQEKRLTKSEKELITRYSDSIKFTKLIRRLKWKSRALLYSHHRALYERQQNLVGGVGFVMDDGEAETMFKIDFFEFYALLERVLVHLLGTVGIAVSAGYGGDANPDADGLRKETDKNGGAEEPKSLRDQLLEEHQQRTLVGDSKTFHGYAHRFHANVLAALDFEGSPLHQILGEGPVRDYLGIAKEFRNRWKDVEERPPGHEVDVLVSSRYEKMLNDLKIEEMLSTILVAIETARSTAEEDVKQFALTIAGSGQLQDALMELDEASGSAPWEAMPDAMDCN